VIIDVWKFIGPLVSVYRLVLFFSDVYRFPDPSVHSLNHVIDWDCAKVINSESSRMKKVVFNEFT